jgi:hypothetical protein
MTWLSTTLGVLVVLPLAFSSSAADVDAIGALDDLLKQSYTRGRSVIAIRVMGNPTSFCLQQKTYDTHQTYPDQQASARPPDVQRYCLDLLSADAELTYQLDQNRRDARILKFVCKDGKTCIRSFDEQGNSRQELGEVAMPVRLNASGDRICELISLLRAEAQQTRPGAGEKSGCSIL